ncbi:MAG TPA: hypothetical protein PLJ47_09010 [Candidatus Hydrogenedentes bacterium]|nr:hypothetical protein [Candidatus Hydrogenedentota bacterium]
MIRTLSVVMAALVICSCKPQKPWSPYESNSLIPNEKHVDSHASSFTANEQMKADIGDVEAQVFINGQISPESLTATVSAQDTTDARDRRLRSIVTVMPPIPESIWAEFEIKCGRNFVENPAVVRISIMVDDKQAGAFSTVLGSKAARNGVRARIDLLKPFAGQVPETFLVKAVGDMYVFEKGTDENKLNPETATSPEHSQALQGTTIRVNIASQVASAEASPADPAPAPAEATPAVVPVEAAQQPPASE